MPVVYKLMDADWASGQAWKVVKALKKKYQPQDTITRVELRQILNGISMKTKDNPTTLFEQIDSIQNRYNLNGQMIDKQDLIAVEIDAAPKDHQEVLTSELQSKGTALTLENLQSMMSSHWQSMGGASRLTNSRSDKEIL